MENITRIPRRHDNQSPAKSNYTELVDIVSNSNDGLQNAPSEFVGELLGPPQSEKVLSLTTFVDVGPFKVEGLIHATNSLSEVTFIIKEQHPDLYSRLSHNGMRVVKKIAGKKSMSLHSWGIAIDLKIDGIEDVKWDDKAFYGLALIAPIFHAHGWFWGGAFRDKETEKGSGVYWSNEDAMHFEISKEKLMEWQRAGLLGPISKSRQESIVRSTPYKQKTHFSTFTRSNFNLLNRGDRGPYVMCLQTALRERNYNILSDGRFGKQTELALIDFQRKHGLIPNGIVGPKTALYLAIF